MLARLVPLEATPGQTYVERRAIPLEVAHAAGARFAPDFAGRPAVIQPLYDYENRLVSLHARYPEFGRGQDKMFTIGPGGGTVNVLGGWRADPLIVVEGLFDALSLAACGWASVATIGRWVPWLREASAGRTVWLALDAGRAGEKEVTRYAAHLCQSQVRRMLPPKGDKDWNTALVKRGRTAVARWVEGQLASS
jgi:Toprim-like